MNAQTTEVAVLIDCSGSMDDVRRDAIASFNAFIREQSNIPGDCNLTAVMFNTRMELFYKGNIHQCPRMTENEFQCIGMTSLYDAMGDTTDAMLKQFMQTLETNRPRVTIGVLSDGDENSSKDWDIHSLSQVVSNAKQMGFVFVMIGMGIDMQDTFNDLCHNLGIDKNHARLLKSNKDIGQAIGLLSGSVTSTRTGGDGSIGLVKVDYNLSNETTNPRDPLGFIKRPSPWSHLKKE